MYIPNTSTVELQYNGHPPSAAKMPVYWSLPLFWDDGKLEFDCTNYTLSGPERESATRNSLEKKGQWCCLVNGTRLLCYSFIYTFYWKAVENVVLQAAFNWWIQSAINSPLLGWVKLDQPTSSQRFFKSTYPMKDPCQISRNSVNCKSSTIRSKLLHKLWSM